MHFKDTVEPILVNLASNAEALACLKDTVCAIGVFDGYHLGHKALIDKTLDIACAQSLESSIITFDIDPDSFFNKKDFKKILTDERRIDLLAQTGISIIIELVFDKYLASLTPDDFLSSLFNYALPNTIVVGSDFKFGKGASGNIEFLKSWGDKHGVRVISIDLLEKDGKKISSTRIRNLLTNGQLEEANELLVNDFAFVGEVIHGKHLGSTLGFPTANIAVDENMIKLPSGVYYAKALIGKQIYKAALSIGAPPSIEGSRPSVEAHIIDFDEDIYGRQIEFYPYKQLRPLLKFDSLKRLKQAIHQDIEQIKLLD